MQIQTHSKNYNIVGNSYTGTNSGKKKKRKNHLINKLRDAMLKLHYADDSAPTGALEFTSDKLAFSILLPLEEEERERERVIWIFWGGG